MSKTRRTNQGGSAIVFIIVGIILTVGLIGSVYFVVKRGELARKEQAIAAYDKEQADKKNTEEADKSEEVNVAETESPNTNVAEVSIPTTNLPVTGPDFIIVNLFGTSLMTIAVTSYLLSLRNRSRSL